MYLALDIETTGLNPDKDHLIEIAAVKFDDQKIIDQYTTLIKPPVPIPELVSHITGITDDMVKTAPNFLNIKTDLQDFIENLPIVGHFISFDVNFLQKKGLSLPNQLIDTCDLARVILLNESSYSLEILSQKYNLPHQNKHRALDDTLVAIALFKFLQQKIAQISPKVLSRIKTVLQKSSWNLKDEFLKAAINTNNLKHTNVNQADPNKSGDDIRKRPPCIQGGKGGGRSSTENSTHFLTSHAKPFPSNSSLKQFIEKILNNPAGKPILIEAELYSTEDYLEPILNFTKNNKKKIVIATNQFLTDKLSCSVAQLLSCSANYICPSRLQHFLKKTTFTASETTLLIKILQWLPQTKTGLKTELVLQKEEYLIWDNFTHLDPPSSPTTNYELRTTNYELRTTNYELRTPNCTPTTCFYLQAKHSAQKASCIILSHETLLKEYQSLLPIDLLLIDQADELEDKTTITFTVRFSEAGFLNKITSLNFNEEFIKSIKTNLTILFGLIGIFFEKHHQSGSQDVHLSPHHESTLEWQNILKSSQNIWERLEAMNTDLGPDFKKFNYLLSHHENTLLTIIKTVTEEIIFKATPIEVAPLLQNTLFKDIPETILLGANIRTQQNYHYIKTQLGLKETNQNLYFPNAKTPKIPFLLINDLPPPASPSSQSAMKKVLRDIIEQKTGRVFIATSSINNAEILYEALAPDFKQKNITLLAQKTGGSGKLLDLYLQNPDHSILIGNYTFFQKLYQTDLCSPLLTSACPPKLDGERRGAHFCSLILPSLPFDPPHDPLLNLRQQKYSNHFMDFALNRTIIKLKKLIDLFIKNGGQEIIALDPRLTNQDYGRTILKSLGSYLEQTPISSHKNTEIID